jgi:hypothetical protein
MARRRPSEPTPSVARGAALVVVAVLVGLFLLRNGIDTSAVVTADRPAPSNGTTTGGATDEGDDVDEPDETTTTEPVARPPDQVSAIVLNGSGVAGAAGVYTTALSDRGYQTAEAGNANARVESTEVYFAPGYDQEAMVLARSIGSTATPQPLGSPPPGEVGEANVVVVLGPDLASVDPPAVEEEPGSTDAGTADTDADADAGADAEAETG